MMTRNQLDEIGPRDPIVNLWYTEELRQERKNIRDLCRKAEGSWSAED